MSAFVVEDLAGRDELFVERDRCEGRKRGSFPVEVDEDAREDDWTRVRCQRVESMSA